MGQGLIKKETRTTHEVSKSKLQLGSQGSTVHEGGCERTKEIERTWFKLLHYFAGSRMKNR